MKKKKAVARSPAKLSTLDDLLKEDGKRDKFQAVAIKEVLAWQSRIEDIEDGALARRRLARKGPRVTLKSLEADLAERTGHGRIKLNPAHSTSQSRTRSKPR